MDSHANEPLHAPLGILHHFLGGTKRFAALLQSVFGVVSPKTVDLNKRFLSLTAKERLEQWLKDIAVRDGRWLCLSADNLNWIAAFATHLFKRSGSKIDVNIITRQLMALDMPEGWKDLDTQWSARSTVSVDTITTNSPNEQAAWERTCATMCCRHCRRASLKPSATVPRPQHPWTCPSLPIRSCPFARCRRLCRAGTLEGRLCSTASTAA